MRGSFVDVLNILGTIIVIAIVIFAVYTLFIDKPFYESSSYNDFEGMTLGEGDDSGTYSTDKPVAEIEVRNISGRIEAEAWNENFVKLDYIKRGPGRHPEVKIDMSGDKLNIAAVYPKGAINFGSVDFFLMIPKELELIEAKSVSGRVEIEGLTMTKQKLSSTSGSVSTDASADLEISSVSGSLSFRTVGENVSASTTSGKISGVIEKALKSGKIDINSVSGRVELEVPADFNADIDLHSVSGSVSSELPVSVTETKRNNIKGEIGEGGTSVEIRTVSGSIKITE